jgi:acylphosphatase
MIVCKRAHFGGRVQGVGFRFTTQRLAEGFPVSGYVRNLATGEVELVAEGEAKDVDAFLDAVAQQMAGYIETQTIREEPVQGFRDFRVRH